MKAYKGTNNDLQCRGFQFETGKVYEVTGNIKLCKNGFHSCENPIDIFNYYPPDGNNRFFEVEQSGDNKTDVNKTVSEKIEIKAELSIKQVFEIGFGLLFSKVKKTKKTTNTAGDYAYANTAGYNAHANTAGDNAHANTAGEEAHANTAGNYAHANTAGEEAHANTAGYKAHANTAGDKAHANTAGYKAHANTAGDYAHANTAGEEAVACALGVNSKAKASQGWIVIVDWRPQDKWTINNIYHAKVGGKIKGIKIKPDTFYWFEDGELKQETKKGKNNEND